MEIRKVIFTSLPEFPLIYKGDNIPEIILEICQNQKIAIENGDIFVLAQKIVSKSEGRIVDLRSVSPSMKAKRIANKAEKDPRLVELILSESHKVIRVKKGTIIVEHKQGFICANAGIDHSNTTGGEGAEHLVLLLPEDSDQTAEQYRNLIMNRISKNIGVLIIDSHGRAWRKGVVGISIGMSGVPGLIDLRGTEDIFGYQLKITQIAAADELAAGASLVMGQANERTPCVLVKGFPYQLRKSSLNELIRPKNTDLFR